MGRISSGVGLISGLQTQQIIDQLISLESRPLELVRDQLKTRKSVQTALTDLSAKLLAVQSASSLFSSASVLHASQAASSNPDVLTATAQGTPAAGSYRFRPVRSVQTQQFVSGGVSDLSTPVGAGTVSIKLGGFVEPATSLDLLNGGLGVRRGSIRITDRSGATATVDLRAAQTMADVLDAINSTEGVRVAASVSGDSLVLTDQTGMSAANLSVQDLAGGATAADLGLAGSVAANTLTGSDVVRLSGNLNLALLNDGNGVRNVSGVSDFRITLKNGATIDVNIDGATKIQGVLDAINSASGNGGQVTASLDAGGDRLRLTDNTGGGGTLSVAALNDSKAARDLGILGSEQGAGVLTGGRALAGLQTVLLKNLRGGVGIANQGQVQFTSRSGATATINFASASTLADVAAAINSGGLGLKASANAAGNGLQITDTTGATASNLIVADVGSSTLASNLGIAANVASTSINGGDANLQYVSENTLLSRLNGGAGVQLGKFRVTDSLGNGTVIDLAGKKTVGDVLLALNTAGIGVSARINDGGDGILLTDVAGGGGGLTVAEQGGTSAADLHLLGSGGTQIDGAFRYTVTLDADDTLQDFVTKLKSSGAPAAASIFNDGSSAQPFRLLLSATRPGASGRLLIDTGASGIQLSRLVEGADALLEVGSGGVNPLLVTSTTNTFAGVVPGLNVTVLGASSQPVTVTVGSDDEPLVQTIKTFVSNFNKARQTIETATSFDPATGVRGVLQADSAAGQVGDSLFNLVGGVAGPADGSIRRLGELGVTVKNGELVLDEGKLQAALAQDPDGVRQFFEADKVGFADRLESVLDQFTDARDGIVTRRISTLDDAVQALTDRTDFLNVQLDAKRARLENQFLALEKALAQIQSQQTSLTQLAQLAQFALSSQSK